MLIFAVFPSCQGGDWLLRSRVIRLVSRKYLPCKNYFLDSKMGGKIGDVFVRGFSYGQSTEAKVPLHFRHLLIWKEHWFRTQVFLSINAYNIRLVSSGLVSAFVYIYIYLDINIYIYVTFILYWYGTFFLEMFVLIFCWRT